MSTLSLDLNILLPTSQRHLSSITTDQHFALLAPLRPPTVTMKYLSTLAFVAVLGLSSAIALPEPIHINIDVQSPSHGPSIGKEQYMRSKGAGLSPVSRPQEVVGLDDPDFHGTYFFLSSRCNSGDFLAHAL